MNFTNKKEIQWLPQSKTAVNKVKQVFGVIAFVFVTILLFLAFYMPLTYKWSQDTWSDLSINEIIYHLTMPMEGTGNGMAVQHVIKCVVPAAVIALIFVAVMIIIKKKVTYTAYIKGLAAAISAVVIANTVAGFWKNMDVSQYVASQTQYSSFIDENYADPNSIDLIFPEQKRNLIYIFLESMETTFGDKSVGGAFEQNIYPELTEIALENENFSGKTQLNGGHAMTGATWTMGGMFAQTSGLPLNISIDKNAMSTQTEFFPGATALGDILEKQGYNQTLLLGSDAAFGGRKLYFETHGNYTIRDYNYYIDNGTLPSDYFVWWGYEDKYLFENAKTELAELSSTGEPFNLTMLTVDTHFEDGYVCSECPQTFDGQYSNVYACASRQVYEFLEWLKQQPYYENTTVVISGDHLTMDNDFCENVDEEYDRKVYTAIINSAVEPEINELREYSTFDNFPTTLAAMGVKIPGDRLALGTNLFSSEKTLYEIYGKETLNEGVASKSELMDNLTAGILKKMITLSPLEYNAETKTIQIIGSDIVASGSGEIDTLKINVYRNDDTSTLHSYQGEDRGDGSYIFTVPFIDFDYTPGTYIVVAVAKDKKATNLAEYSLGAISIDLSDPEAEQLRHEQVGFSGTRCSEFDYTTGTFGIEYYEYNSSNTLSISFAVWKEGAEDSVRWVEAVKGQDGVYRATINVFDFGQELSKYTIHTYYSTMDGKTEFKDGMIYTIQ